jgi:hypothetical protein
MDIAIGRDAISLRAPGLIYASRGVPDTTNPGPTNFGKKLCTLILIEIGFSRDLGYDKKHTEKTEKYSFLVAALKKYGGRGVVAIPIGHAGTTLTRTLDILTAAFSTVAHEHTPITPSRLPRSPPRTPTLGATTTAWPENFQFF